MSYLRATAFVGRIAATADRIAVHRSKVTGARRSEHSAPRQGAPQGASLQGASRGYFYGVLFLYAIFVVLSPHPPLLQDYPTWVYEAVAAAHTFAGHPDPQFIVKSFPVPNALSDLGLGALCGLFGWNVAARLWIVIYLCLSAFSYKHFMRSLNVADSRANWVVPSLCICNLCFWYGFLNFQFGVTLMVLFCSCLLRHPDRRFLLAALLTLTFLSHAVPFAVCGLVLMIHVLVKRSFRALWACIPVVGLGAWYLYGRFVVTGNAEGRVQIDTHVPYLSPWFALYKINSYFKSVGIVHPNIGFPSFGKADAMVHWSWLGLAAMVGFALFYIFASAATAALRERRPEIIFWAASATSFLVGLFCPSAALGIADPGSRFIVCALVLAALCTRYRGRIASLACGGSAAIGIAGALLFANIAMNPYPAGMLAPPTHLSERLALVAPQSRAYYYSALESGKMNLPTFDTALLLNRYK